MKYRLTHNVPLPELCVQTKFDRRTALKAIGAGSSTLLVAVSSTDSKSSQAIDTRIENWSAAEWRKRIGNSIRFQDLDSPSETMTLRFLDVKETLWSDSRNNTRPPELRRASLSMLFEGAPNLESGCYRIQIPNQDPLVVFLNQISVQGYVEGTVYEVILN